MTKPTARPARFLHVALIGEFGIRRIVVTPWVEGPEGETYRESSYHTAVPKGRFSGAAIEGLEMSAYVGHSHPLGDNRPDDVWGWTYGYDVGRIDHAHEAKRILRGLEAIRHEDDRRSEEPGLGHTDGFTGWLRRMAAILGAKSIRIRRPSVHGAAFLGGDFPPTQGAELVLAIAEAWGRSGDIHAAYRQALGPEAAAS